MRISRHSALAAALAFAGLALCACRLTDPETWFPDSPREEMEWPDPGPRRWKPDFDARFDLAMAEKKPGYRKAVGPSEDIKDIFSIWNDPYYLRGLALMYRLSGREDRGAYADEMARILDLLASSRDDKRGRQDFRGRSAAAWSTTLYNKAGDERPVAWAVHSGLFALPMVELALLIRDDPALAGRPAPRDLELISPAYPAAPDGAPFDYGQMADALALIAAETMEAHETEWRSRGSYVFPEGAPIEASGLLPHNQSLQMGLCFIALYEYTGDPRYREKAQALAQRFKANLKLQEPGGSYVWDYKEGGFLDWPRTEDIMHGSIDVEFAARCHEAGIVFSDEDLGRFSRSLLRNYDLRRAEGGGFGFPYFLDGASSGANIHPGQVAAWLSLEAHAPGASYHHAAASNAYRAFFSGGSSTDGRLLYAYAAMQVSGQDGVPYAAAAGDGSPVAAMAAGKFIPGSEREFAAYRREGSDGIGLLEFRLGGDGLRESGIGHPKGEAGNAPAGKGMAAGDFDGDGLDELAVAGSKHGSALVLGWNGDGFEVEGEIFADIGEERSWHGRAFAAGDFDPAVPGDELGIAGDQGILVYSFRGGQARLLREIPVSCAGGFDLLCAGDLDGDGQDEAIVKDRDSGDVGAAPGFRVLVDAGEADWLGGICLDANDDGRVDLALSDEASNLHIFDFGEGGKGRKFRREYFPAGWDEGIVSAMSIEGSDYLLGATHFDGSVYVWR